MRLSRRIMAIGATIALAVVGGLALSSPASAATLTVQNSCTQTDVGPKTWQCDLTITGGTLPYTTTWSGDGLVVITYTDTYHAQGRCGTFTNHTVVAYVTDGSGTQVAAYGDFRCSYQP